MKNKLIFTLFLLLCISTAHSAKMLKSSFPNLAGETELALSFGFGNLVSGEQLDFVKNYNDSSHLSSDWGLSAGYYFSPYLGLRLGATQHNLTYKKEVIPNNYTEGDELDFETVYVLEATSTRLGLLISPLFMPGIRKSVVGIEFDLGTSLHFGKSTSKEFYGVNEYTGMGYYIFPKISYKGELLLLNLGLEFESIWAKTDFANKSGKSDFGGSDIQLVVELGYRL